MKDIFIIPGSSRTGSFNVKLGNAILAALSHHDAPAKLIDLSDYALPIFSEDIKKDSIPKGAITLAKEISKARALIFVSPEYNSSITPLLKNAIDWVSVLTPEHGVADIVFKNKLSALTSCSPGGLGGIRGLYHLRSVLMNVGCQIITEQLAVGNASDAFDAEGNLTQDRTSLRLNELIETLLERS